MGVDKWHGYSKPFLKQVYREVKKRPRKEGEAARERQDFLSIPYHLKNLKVVQKIAKRDKK